MSDKEDDKPKLELNKSPVSARKAKKLLFITEYLSKQESRVNCKKVSKILKKSAIEHTEDDKATLAKHQDIVTRISKNKEKRKLNEQRVLETEDSTEVVQNKCRKLARFIQQSKKTVIYTGAGISTAASIPDYRGPQGVWTLLQKGEQLTPQDLSDAEPTLTHMCITQLHQHGHVTHVVSQNCDGLHVRSGLPRHVLSEVHGNMFIEICHSCRPHREYVRLFDVTENTGVRRHFTGRHCQKCGGKLKDTIVHFGEKGGMKSPYRWKEAVRAANKCDLILCLGSSLKILKKYACLWCMDRVKQKRPKLVVINLQWTPKDESATLKINGRCDDVMERVMQIFGYSIPQYSREEDPIFPLATSLVEEEEETTNKKVLQIPAYIPKLRSHGISRTPTPSDSSDSQTSIVSSADSYDAFDELNIGTIEQQPVTVNSDYFSTKHESDSIMDTKHTLAIVNTEEMCLSKSERICNQAKIAMQERLVNARIIEMYASCPNIQDETSSASNGEQSQTVNGVIQQGLSHTKSTVEQQPKVQYDPLRGGPFDPGPTTHDEKLVYLQSLQSQLEELKTKQRTLKQQDIQHMKQQRQQQTKQTKHLGKQETKQHMPLKQEINKQKSITLETCQNVHLKEGTSEETSVEQGTSTQLCLKHETSLQVPVKNEPLQQLPTFQQLQKQISLPQQQNMTPKKESTVQSSVTKNNICNKVKLVYLTDANISGSNSTSVKTAVSENPQVAAMEHKLKKNISEQKELKRKLTVMLTNQQKMEDQVRVQHQNEHLRLHQHFLIQEQLRQQTSGSKGKEEEILKLFVFQQQALITQQTAHVQLCRQNYMIEKEKVETDLSNLKKSHSEFVKKFENLKTKQIIYGTQCLISPQTSAKSTSQNICSLTVETYSNETNILPSPLGSPELTSPSKKDHSIASILQESNDQLSPDRTSSSDNGTRTCKPCQFLNDYGMSKKWCNKCDELQTDQGAVKQLLVSSKSGVDSSFHQSMSVPKLKSCHTNATNSNKIQNVQVLSDYNYVLDLEATTAESLPGSGADFTSVGSENERNNQNYLSLLKSSVKVESKQTHKANSDLVSETNDREKSTNEPHGIEVQIVIPISTVSASLSPVCNSEDLSPLIPYASQNVARTNETRQCRSVITDEASTNSSHRPDCTQLDKNSEKVTFSPSMENEVVDDVVKEMLQESRNEKFKHISGIKPVRSHSQSEIYDQKIEELHEPTRVRHIRCRSHSELVTTHNESAGDTEDCGEGGSSAGDIEETEEGVEDSGKCGKKRKLGRCLSVPGWFGKGLNIKKRKRH